MPAFELRPQQRTTVDKGKEILARYRLLYMACQPRTGKSFMSLTIVKELGFRKPCFITKKIAIASIQSDYQKSGYKFDRITITNHESIHKLVPGQYDIFIIDEAHSNLGAFPKPGKRAQEIKKLIGKLPVILMSGTPTPESPSQIFHQLWVSYYSPFSVHRNFYDWAKEYVKQYDVRDQRGNVIKKQVKQKYLGGFQVNDYSEGLEDKIKEITKHYMVFLSQAEAGFETVVDEKIIDVDIDPKLYTLMKVLKRDKVYRMKNGSYLIADTPVKMQSLFHQISSGTVISTDINGENNQYNILDDSKALAIKRECAGRKIAIFYKYISEGELLRKVFTNWTDSPEVFNSKSDVTFIRQFVSGREGVNLRTADSLIGYNIDFSATTYFQFRERQQDRHRIENGLVLWFFSKKGIERHIHKVVGKKKPFTVNYFVQALKEF